MFKSHDHSTCGTYSCYSHTNLTQPLAHGTYFCHTTAHLPPRETTAYSCYSHTNLTQPLAHGTHSSYPTTHLLLCWHRAGHCSVQPASLGAVHPSTPLQSLRHILMSITYSCHSHTHATHTLMPLTHSCNSHTHATHTLMPLTYSPSPIPSEAG